MTSTVWPPTDGQNDPVLMTMTPDRVTPSRSGRSCAKRRTRLARSPEWTSKKTDERAGRERGLAVYAGWGGGQSSQSGRSR